LASETFQFSVDSALLGELGERLVTTVHVALAELVKNAYDAEADSVVVKILPEEGQAARVIIQDNGTGMTQEQVRDFWMKIGTVNKTTSPVSVKYGRNKTGSKGIGRFACRRLGLNLRLATTAKLSRDRSTPIEKYETTTIEFDWTSFKPGVEVESVDCEGTISRSREGSAGTTLEIWGGQSDEWETRGFNFLQRQLALLASNRGMSRPGYKDDPGFNVTLNAPGFSDVPVDIRGTVIDASWGTLTAKIGSDGEASLSLNAKGLGGTRKHTSSQRFRRIANTSLRIGILPTKKEEARRPEILASYVLSELVNDWGGIQVRFNGFRVVPYGDPGDDWLRIDADRGRRVGKPDGELYDFAASIAGVDASRSLLNMLGMRNYLGQVELTSDVEGLIPRIDRQGFVENEVFEEVRKFVRFAIDWANIYRDHYIRLREHEESTRAREAVKTVLDLDVPQEDVVPKAASFLKSEIKRIVNRLPQSQQRETEQALVKTVKAIEAINADSQKQLEHLRLVASASTLTLLFAHEVRTVIGGLGAASVRLRQLAASIPAKKKELGELANQLGATKQRFDNLVGMTGIVGSFRNNRTLTTLHLKSAVERAIQCFHLLINNYHITVDDQEVPTDLKVGPMIEGELYTILLNLLSNAVKSVIAYGGTSRRICVEARQSDSCVIVRMSDSGLGLAPDFYEEVFTPFIADPGAKLYDALEERANPEDASIIGTGSGLGLSIARDIARSRGGDVRFVHPELPWKATLEIELP